MIDAAAKSLVVSPAPTAGHTECIVAGELVKQRAGSFEGDPDAPRRLRPKVDFTFEDRRHDIVGTEVKATSSPGTAGFAALQYPRDRLGDGFVAGIAIYVGERPVPFPGTPRATFMTWRRCVADLGTSAPCRQNPT
jgi:hypothetical protein